MDLQLDGSTALTTASSSGLGLASAKALARDGQDVAVAERPEFVLGRVERGLSATTDRYVCTLSG